MADICAYACSMSLLLPPPPPPWAVFPPGLLFGPDANGQQGEGNLMELGVRCQYLRWQAACLVQHFHPVKVSKVLNDVKAAAVAVAATATITQ